MKIKLILYALIILGFYSCNNDSKSQQIETKIYSYTDDYDKSKIEEIDLEDTDLNFKELASLIMRKQDKDSLTGLSFHNKNMKKLVIPFNDTYGHLGERNILRITEDSILWPFNTAIKKLPEVLKTHYENDGKNYKYSQSYKRVFIQLTIDTSSNGNQIKESLNSLLTEFDKLNLNHNDSLKLKLHFSYFRQLHPPPPPPKNISLD